MRYVATIFVTLLLVSIVYVGLSILQVGSVNETIVKLEQDIDAIETLMKNDALTSFEQLNLMELIQSKLRLIIRENDDNENTKHTDENTISNETSKE